MLSHTLRQQALRQRAYRQQQQRWVSASGTERRELLIGHLQTLNWKRHKPMTINGLRRQFHKMAQRAHPDLVGSSGNDEMQKINLAFRELSEFVKRCGGEANIDALHSSNVVFSDDGDCTAFIVAVQKAVTATDLEKVLESVFQQGAAGHISHDDKLLVNVIEQWGQVHPYGAEHTAVVLACLIRWCEVFDVVPPIMLLNSLLEDYSIAFKTGKIPGSVMSHCWPRIVEFLQDRCELTDHTLSIIRRMDPTVRV